MLLGTIFGALITAGGVYSVLQTDGAVGSIVILLIGAILLLIAVGDFPVSTSFDADGLTRRPLLNRQRLEWDRIDQLTRTRPSIAARARGDAPGGLVAKVGRRRYLLVDQCESFDEYRMLGQLLEATSHEVRYDDLIAPPEGQDPTYTYRRSRWAHDPE